LCLINHSDDELQETADDKTIHGQEPATSKLDHNASIDDESKQANGTENAAHGKWTGHLGHAEEVRLVG
jgi:hypothetical protein